MARTKIRNPDVFDVIVAGGGLAGMAMAARLGSTGMRILLVEREEEAKLTSPAFDGRTTAIAYGSKLILEDMGVWKSLAPAASPILDIQVADQHAPQTVDFESDRLSDAPFGYIVDNIFFRAGLIERIKSFSNITLRCGTSITALDEKPEGVRLSFNDGGHAQAPLLIAADGRRSFCRNAAGIKMREWSYKQSALVCIIAHEEPHEGQAIENFYPDGPFAMLPMTNNRTSIVWSEKPETAETLKSLPEEEFLSLLAARGATHLGKLQLVTPRMLYPLTFMLADELYKGRVVLIGEAAHAMHPIAGQGFNLSLRDVSALGALIEAAWESDTDHGAKEVLQCFAGKRHLDHFTFMMATDVLEKLFSNNITPVKWARRFGLGMVQQLPFAKNFFGKMAMGLLN